jgi:EpsG family
MTYYVIPFVIWTTFCIWKALHTSKELNFTDYIFALPLILLVVLRGEVGTDTANYIGNAQYVIWWHEQGTEDFEVGYALLVRLFAMVTSDPQVVIAFVSLLAAILFFVMLHMWENGQCIVSLVFIPACFYNFTMNGLRMGIAFPLAAIAILQLEKKRWLAFYVLALAAISIQMTTAILLPLLVLARINVHLSRRGILYSVILGFSILGPAYHVLGDKVADKMALYYLYSSSFVGGGTPSGTSGLSLIILSAVCSLIAWRFPEKRHRYVGLSFFAIQVAFFGLTQVTYAGIRFQSMALFAQLLGLSFGIERPIQKGQLAVVLLLCCLAFSAFVRNAGSSAGEVSAFIPYRFAWESQ